MIDFDDAAYLDYPLGDPGNADSSFDKIDADGGTFIAEGVDMAIQQLTAGNSGPTDKRSAIVVFTDGADSSTSTLVSSINNATRPGYPCVLRLPRHISLLAADDGPQGDPRL